MSVLNRRAGLLVLILLQMLCVCVTIFYVSRNSQQQGGNGEAGQMRRELERVRFDLKRLGVKMAALERTGRLTPALPERSRERVHNEAEDISDGAHESEFVKGRNSNVDKQKGFEVASLVESAHKKVAAGREPVQSHMLYRDASTWHDDSASCNYLEKIRFAQMKTSVGNLRVYVHEPEDDIYISKHLLREGRWEEGLLQLLLKQLMADDDLVFLDIGANIGVYTLTAAKLGRRVVAVEPFPRNVQRLCRSLKDNQLQSHVTLVRNALSNSRQVLSFKTRKDSVGHTKVEKSSGSSSAGNTVQAILLDDMIDILSDAKGVVIKLDVEGHETKVLQGGKRFFRELRVPCVLMEWGIVMNSVEGSQVVLNLMAQNSFQPFDPATNALLHRENYLEWPGNVLWLKKSTH